MAGDRSLGFSITALDKASKTFVKLGQTVEKLERKLQDLDKTKADPQITVGTEKAERQVGAFATGMQRRITRAVQALPDIELDADASAADRRIAEIRRELASLSNQRIGIDVDATAASAQVDRLQRELAQLGARSSNIQVQADTAAASAALRSVSAQANRLDGRQVTVGVQVNGQRALTMFGLITAGLATVGAAAPAAAGALAAVPAAAGVAAQGVGTLTAAFTGIGDAVDALASAEEAAGQSAQSSARAHTAAARQIHDAGRAVEAAELAQAQAAEQGREAIAAAKAEVEQAHADAAVAAEQAAQRVEAAEDQLALAHERVRWALIDLHEARRQAIRDLQDLREETRDNALSVESAEIGLIEARQRLAEVSRSGTATELDLRKARLRVAQAEDRLSDANRQSRRDRADLTEAEREGIAGADGVVSARRAVAQAERGVTDARENLQQALRAQTRSEQQSAASIAAAVAGVAEAQEDAAERNAAAARRTQQAQLQLQRAIEDAAQAMGGASSQARKLEQAMAKLSPAGQDFARFLHDEVIPGLRGIGKATQEALLPDLTTAMRNMAALGPEVEAGLVGTADVLGELAVAGSEMMTSGPWQRDLGTIMAANNRVLGDFGVAGLAASDAMRSLTVASLPMVERFSQFVERGAQTANTFIQTRRATGELDAFVQQAADTLAQLAEVATDVVVGVAKLADALGPLGGVLLETVGNVVEFIGEFAQAHETLVQFAAAAALVVTSASKLGSTVAGIAATAGAARAGFATLGSAMSLVVPSRLEKRMGGLNTRMQGAALTAGVLTEKFTRNSAAGMKVATAGGRIASVATRMAPQLAVAAAAITAGAVAYDALTASATEGAEALLKGGREAEEMTRKLQGQSTGWFQLGASLSEAQVQADTMLDRMDPLAAATALAHRAEADYNLAVERFGENSPQAIQAQKDLAFYTNIAADKQNKAKEATRSRTEEMIRQTNLALGVLGAEANLTLSRQRVADAQARVNRLARQNKQGTPAWVEAQAALTQAVGDNATAVQRHARLLGEQAGMSEVAGLQQDALARELLRMVEVLGVTDPRVIAYARNLDDAALSAIGAKRETNKAGDAVINLPDGKEITIEAVDKVTPVVNQIERRLANLSNQKYSVAVLLNPQWEQPDRAVPGVGTAPAPPNLGGYFGGLANANGSITRFAAGSERHVAQIARPGAMRLWAEPETGGEAYIPLAESKRRRSVAILGQVAEMFGFDVLGMARGGIARPPAHSPSGAPRVRAWEDGSARYADGLAWDPEDVRFERSDNPLSGYAPGYGAGGGTTRVDAGTVPQGAWDALLGMGYRGNPRDDREALYVSRDDLRRALAMAEHLQQLQAAAEQTQVSLADLQARGLTPLSVQITRTALPALVSLAQRAGIDATQAVQLLQAALPHLTQATFLSGQAIQTTWAGNTAAVESSRTRQTQAFLQLASVLGLSTGQMRALLTGLEGHSNARWAGMRATTGREVNRITGPIYGRYGQGMGTTARNLLTLHDGSNQLWRQMRRTTGREVGEITGPIFHGFHVGMKAVTDHADFMQRAFGDSMGRIRGHTARPIRYAINVPINRGMGTAWNKVNEFFALDKPWRPITANFARGGAVNGGVPNQDSVPAMLMPGEFVVSKPAVQSVGADNLARWHQAARGASSDISDGLFAGYAAGGEVIARGAKFARAQVGKPYIWGGVGPAGYDCSGYVGAIANVLTGRNPYQRIGSTGTAPWPGWGRGLGSAYGVGWFTGSPGHMAGTLAGMNVESAGGRGPAVGPAALGAKAGMFNGHMFLPQVGGRFIGGGGGGYFDAGAYVQKQMAGALRQADSIHPDRFGAGRISRAAEELARDSIEGSIAWSAQNILGGLGTVNASGPVVEQVRRVAARYGWDQGPEWRALYELVSRESSWNPQAANPTSSARGLFQKMTSIHGPVEPTAAGQARWGLGYIDRRYGSPSAALRFHNANNYYDRGGMLHGRGWFYKDTERDERVLNPQQTRNDDHLRRIVEVLDTRRSAPRPVAQLVSAGAQAAGAAGGAAAQPMVQIGAVQLPERATVGDLAGAVRHEMRVARKRAR